MNFKGDLPATAGTSAAETAASKTTTEAAASVEAASETAPAATGSAMAEAAAAGTAQDQGVKYGKTSSSTPVPATASAVMRERMIIMMIKKITISNAGNLSP